jgi:hypothetical protein
MKEEFKPGTLVRFKCNEYAFARISCRLKKWDWLVPGYLGEGFYEIETTRLSIAHEDDLVLATPTGSDNDDRVFWDCDDSAEHLYWETPDEAVESFLDGLPCNDWPRMVTVYKYTRADVDAEFLHGSIVLGLLEDLDEHFRHETEDPTTPTVEMLAAERRFIDTVIKHYNPSVYKVTGQEEIDVASWVRKNTSWVEEEDVAETLRRLERVDE